MTEIPQWHVAGDWFDIAAALFPALAPLHSRPMTAFANQSCSGISCFGWGARDYYMARDPGIGDILRAVASGPAVMLVIPLKMALKRFSGFRTLLLSTCRRGGIERLSQLLWNYLATDEEGAPHRIGAGLYPESVFYASTGTYNLSHTCNTWTAAALRVTGLPVSATGVVFAAQVLDQLPPLLEGAREHSERTSNSLPGGT